MLGAIAGDIVGSAYQRSPVTHAQFPLFQAAAAFTDKTVLLVAVADALLADGGYAASLRRWGRRYPRAGYRPQFYRWLFSPHLEPYYSYANDAAARACPVGYAFDSGPAVLEQSCRSAAVTHHHPEGVEGAQAVALSVFLARRGESKQCIRQALTDRLGYDLSRPLSDIRPTYRFDPSCRGSVPPAITAFLESENVEDAIRKAISLGGDTGTLACIAGGIAEAFFQTVPESIVQEVESRLPVEFINTIDAFYQRFALTTRTRRPAGVA